MTYNVFGGTLNPAQSNPIQSQMAPYQSGPKIIRSKWPLRTASLIVFTCYIVQLNFICNLFWPHL